MPILSVLIFFVISIFILLAGLYIFLTFYNKQTRTTTDKFTEHAKTLNPTVFQNIKIRYWTTNGQKTYVYPNNRCDLYLFDNCLAIVRRQDLIFKVFFTPILITSDIATTKNMFNYLDVYKPDSITFKQIIKGEVDIKLTDLIYKHFKIDITFKGLTNEQTAQLEKIKSWH
jgi:hypothetical protein